MSRKRGCEGLRAGTQLCTVGGTWSPRGPARGHGQCKRHTTIPEPSQLSSAWACFAVASKNLSTCFHHKHLTTACRDVFLEETWQDMSHTSPGEQLDALPLIPTLQFPSSELHHKHTQDTSGTARGSTAQGPGKRHDFPASRHSVLSDLGSCGPFTMSPISWRTGKQPEHLRHVSPWTVGRQTRDTYPRPACPAPDPRTSRGRCSSQCPGLSFSGTH